MNRPQGDAMSLHALVEKWREAAKSERIIAVTTPGIDKYACQVQARLMDKFADELAAALAGGGEAVAWVDRYDLEAVVSGRRTHTSLYPSKADGDDIPLFTHPAGAVQVTDEVVERVAWAIMPKMGDTREIEIATAKGDGRWTQAVETAKAAIEAINPGGSRDHD